MKHKAHKSLCFEESNTKRWLPSSQKWGSLDAIRPHQHCGPVWDIIVWPCFNNSIQAPMLYKRNLTWMRAQPVPLVEMLSVVGVAGPELENCKGCDCRRNLVPPSLSDTVNSWSIAMTPPDEATSTCSSMGSLK